MSARYPRRGMYSACRGDGSPFMLNGQIQTDQVASQSKWDTVVIDASPGTDHRPDLLQAFRAVNPNIHLYAYCMGSVFWNNPHPYFGELEKDYPYAYYQAVHSTNGELYCTNGKLGWAYSNVNCASRATMDALSGVIINKVIKTGLWDGLFLDVIVPELLTIHAGADIIDIARYGYQDEQNYMADWTKNVRFFAQNLRDASPANFPIEGNYGQGGLKDIFNGWMRENFPYQNAYDPHMSWQENMLCNYWGYSGYLSQQHEYIWHGVINEGWLISSPGYDQNTSKQVMRFGLGSATLGNGFHSFSRDETQSTRRFWWYPEYDLDLGDPVTEAYPMSGGTFAREFTKGAVVVNPQWLPKSVYFGNSFERAFTLTQGGVKVGADKTGFSVPARDAIFLLR